MATCASQPITSLEAQYLGIPVYVTPEVVVESANGKTDIGLAACYCAFIEHSGALLRHFFATASDFTTCDISLTWPLRAALVNVEVRARGPVTHRRLTLAKPLTSAWYSC